MDNYNEKLPEKIRAHIPSILESSGLPHTDESFSLLARNWLEKEEMFKSQIHSLDMIEITSFEKNDKRGALMLTYSGSLISIGSMTASSRRAEYASIKLRNDVPDLLVIEKTNLAKDIAIDQGIELEESPIKSTSALYIIAVCKEDVSPEEQEKRIREATIFLTNGFVKLNRTMMQDDENIPDQFNLKSIIKYIAHKNNLTQVQARQVLEDYLQILESGMLLGDKVSLGKIGKLTLKKKAAQKARIIKNPATGEDMTIGAKPEMYVPKIYFSNSLKEKAEQVAIKE